ncbi:MAG: FG-GAP repeat domain-containing protein [Candidatus Sulfotelmatobacter sp.]
MTAKAGVAKGGWSVSAGFFDYDNDGKLDLFVTRYMNWDTKHSKDCGGNYHTYCPPEEFPSTSCRTIRLSRKPRHSRIHSTRFTEGHLIMNRGGKPPGSRRAKAHVFIGSGRHG